MPDRGWRRDIRALEDASEFKLTDTALAQFQSTRRSAYRNPLVDPSALPVPEPSPHFHACAASAVAAAIDVTRLVNEREAVTPSVRFLYYVGRWLQCREHENNGASIFATLRAAQVIGFCPTGSWQLPQDGDYSTAPDQSLYDEARNAGILNFVRLSGTIENLTQCLDRGYAIVFGMYVDRDFLKEDSRTKSVFRRPNLPIVDRHCLLAVGYDERGFIVRDSLGPQRGKYGYINIDRDYVTDPLLTGDFWMITDVADSRHRWNDLEDIRRDYTRKGAEFRNEVKAIYDELKADAPKNPRQAPADRTPPIAREIEQLARR